MVKCQKHRVIRLPFDDEHSRSRVYAIEILFLKWSIWCVRWFHKKLMIPFRYNTIQLKRGGESPFGLPIFFNLLDIIVDLQPVTSSFVL